MKKFGEKEARKELQQSMERQGYKKHSYNFYSIPHWIYSANSLMKFAEDGLKNQKRIFKSIFPPKIKNGVITRGKYEFNDLNLNPAALLYGLAFENLFKAILIKQGKITSHKASKDCSHNLDEMATKTGLPFTQNELKWISVLEHKVFWNAKYPTPTKPEHFYRKDKNGRIPMLGESIGEYFELKKLYQKILKFLRNERFHSKDLEDFHSLSKKYSKLWDYHNKLFHEGRSTKEINLRIKENDQKIEEVVGRLNPKYQL